MENHCYWFTRSTKSNSSFRDHQRVQFFGVYEFVINLEVLLKSRWASEPFFPKVPFKTAVKKKQQMGIK